MKALRFILICMMIFALYGFVRDILKQIDHSDYDRRARDHYKSVGY